MQRLVMFIQSVLMLLVAIQVTTACTCSPLTIEEAMCGSKTVIMATVESEEIVDSQGNPAPVGSSADYTKYEMYLDTIYKQGPQQLAEEKDYFDIVVSRKSDLCGLLLELDKEYYLSGNVTKKGRLDITTCELISRVPFNEGETNEDTDTIDLLNGTRPPKCGGVKRRL